MAGPLSCPRFSVVADGLRQPVGKLGLAGGVGTFHCSVACFQSALGVSERYAQLGDPLESNVFASDAPLTQVIGPLEGDVPAFDARVVFLG